MKKVIIYSFCLCALVCAGVFGYSTITAGTNQSQEMEQSLFARISSSLLRPASSPEALDSIGYRQYCENEVNGLKKTKAIKSFLFSAFYQPVDYLLLREFAVTDSVQKKLLETKRSEYGGMTYFSFRIENTEKNIELLKINLNDEAEYYARLEYMAFKMQQDFKLINGNDTLDCSMYHFERVYGLAPIASFILGFPAANTKKDIKLWYHDKVFKSGIVILNFESEATNNLPKLDI